VLNLLKEEQESINGSKLPNDNDKMEMIHKIIYKNWM
jgi:hypothetical protein